MWIQLNVSLLPHLPKHTWYLVIYTSRIGEKHSTSHHLGGKSQSGTFYPPNRSLCTTLVNGCIHKSYTFDFIWVNNENLWSPKALSGKIWVNCSNSYFYRKNCQVSTSKELSKTKKKHKFSLNSVNGGHSFFVSNKIWAGAWQYVDLTCSLEYIKEGKCKKFGFALLESCNK